MAQPIIRGVQAVGGVDVIYYFNKDLRINPGVPGVTALTIPKAKLSAGVNISGFRLDSEFIRMAQHIASSQVIPILGGGGLALTNNNRSGVMNLNCSRVSGISVAAANLGQLINTSSSTAGGTTAPTDVEGNAVEAYDIVTLALAQQASPGGDDLGADFDFVFKFSGVKITVKVYSCTVAEVAPLVLAGNDASNYNLSYNYLNWGIDYKVA